MRAKLVLKLAGPAASLPEFGRLFPFGVKALNVEQLFPDAASDEAGSSLFVVEVEAPNRLAVQNAISELRADSRVKYCHLPAARHPLD